jgi:hypothetical protein
LSVDRLRWRARATVSAVTFAFGLQLVYLAVAEEPYPAVTMPRFGWAGPGEASTIDIPIVEISMRYADATTKVLTHRQLLSSIPDGHHSAIMGNVLSPLPTDPRPRRAPPNKLEPPAWLFPGYNLARVSRLQPEHVSSLRDWLRGRARDFYADSPPVMCTVNWYVDAFPYDTRSDAPRRSAVQREVSGRFEIDLNEPAHNP